MSAFGPKQTCSFAPRMSAFGGKADMTYCGISLSRSLSGVKRTCLVASHMSAFDPMRTLSDTLRRATGNWIHDTAWNRVPGPCNRNHTSKDTLYGLGPHKFGVAGTLYMTARDEYLLKAAELSAMAQAETDRADKVEFENLARVSPSGGAGRT